MIVVLFLILFLLAVLASGLGTETSDRTEMPRSEQPWYPLVGIH